MAELATEHAHEHRAPYSSALEPALDGIDRVGAAGVEADHRHRRLHVNGVDEPLEQGNLRFKGVKCALMCIDADVALATAGTGRAAPPWGPLARQLQSGCSQTGMR